MKRLISLAMLFLCSLTLCGAAAFAQTWRLTDDGYSDNIKPCIARTNSGRIWVVWLNNANSQYDVMRSRYISGSWEAPVALHEDPVDQTSCDIAYDSLSNSLYVAWDSAGQFQITNSATGWSVMNVADSMHQLDYSKHFSICTDRHGNLNVAWSSPVYTGWGYQVQGNLETYDGFPWDSTEIVLPAYTTSDEDVYFVTQVVCRPGERPYILALHEWDGLVYWDYGGDIRFTHWQGDSIWAPTWVDSWHDGPSAPIGISLVGSDTTLVLFCDNLYNTDSSMILCRRYVDSIFSLDTTYIIAVNPHFHSGAVCNSSRPTLAWSDSHSIFLNTYYDTIWSHPPVRISDTSLHNCLNPDIVAANDSTVWVCYQNDGDIYVTRTSIPLGVSGKPMDQIPNPQSKISIKAWPNPASNVIHFAYTLPNKRNSSVSIYDIAGRLVRKLDISENQINWNCADNDGRKVASGVYFARLRSNDQETIQRISIIK